MKTNSGIAYILKTQPINEKDLIVSFFSLEHGKFNAIVKGTKKPKNSWGARFLLFSKVSFDYLIPKSRNAIGKIIRNEVIDAPPKLSTNGYLMASVCAESILALLQESQEIKKIFNLLEQSLKTLEKDEDLENFLSAYLTKLFTFLGFLPIFTHCTDCGKKFSEDSQIFRMKSGEIFCENCHEEINPNLSFNEVKVLSFWQRADIDHCLMLDLSFKISEKLASLIMNELNTHLKNPLKSLVVLREMS